MTCRRLLIVTCICTADTRRNTFDSLFEKGPPTRRGIALDIGANVGTHSLAFAQHFAHVHAFEPNPALWPSFERNITLNHLSNVHLHKVGLGNKDADLPFYLIEKSNFGLGTVSRREAGHDLPLKEVGRVPIRAADRYLVAKSIGPIDAIKMDVQGYELEVVRGLADVLQRDRPIVGVEASSDTKASCRTFERFQQLFPSPANLFRFERGKGNFGPWPAVAASYRRDVCAGRLRY